VLRGFIIFLGVSSSLLSQDSSREARKSFGFSCLRKPFVSVSASTPKRDRAPSVQLQLTDPSGRTKGNGTRGLKIPSSRYGEVVQIPNAPNSSRAIAIEVCDAEQGTYEFHVREAGIQPYLLEVRGMGDTDNIETLALHHVALDGRRRSYKFIFKIDGRHVTVRWLDDAGQELQRVENNEW
jgi:hypothetical protein